MLTRAQADQLLRFLREGGPATRRGVPRLIPVGSYRRGGAPDKDLDVLVQDFDLPLDAEGARAVADARRAAGLAYFRTRRSSGGELHRQYRGTFHPARGSPFPASLDLFRFAPRDLPFALLAYTGDAAFVVRMRAQAKRRGLWLDQYGLFRRRASPSGDVKGARVRVPASGASLSERDIFRALGITYKRPEDRHA